MRAALHRLAHERERFIARRSQDQNRGIRCGLDHPVVHLEALTIGKHEVKQHHLDTTLAQSCECIRESCHRFDTECAILHGRKPRLDLAGIGGCVFDDKYGGRGIADGQRTFARRARFGSNSLHASHTCDP